MFFGGSPVQGSPAPVESPIDVAVAVTSKKRKLNHAQGFVSDEVDCRNDEPTVAVGIVYNQGSSEVVWVEYSPVNTSQQLCGTVGAPILFPDNNPEMLNYQLNNGDTYDLNTSADYSNHNDVDAAFGYNNPPILDSNPHSLTTSPLDNNPHDLANFAFSNPHDLANFAFSNPHDLANFAFSNPHDLANFAFDSNAYALDNSTT